MGEMRSNVARISTRTRGSNYTPTFPSKSRVIKTSVDQEHMGNKDFLTRSRKSRVITTKGIA